MTTTTKAKQVENDIKVILTSSIEQNKGEQDKKEQSQENNMITWSISCPTNNLQCN